MILKRDSSLDDEQSSVNKQSKTNEKSSDASSSTLGKFEWLFFLLDLVMNRNIINSIDIASTCRSTEFSCRDGSCIPYYDVCNSYDDCPSGIDESMCSPGI